MMVGNVFTKMEEVESIDTFLTLNVESKYLDGVTEDNIFIVYGPFIYSILCPVLIA